MSFWKSMSKRHCGACDSGNVSMIFATVASLMLICAGGAVDIARWNQARTVTSTALDAAVLAGGRALQSNPSDVAGALVVAKNVYDANTARRSALVSDTVSFVAADNNQAITAQGDAVLATSLLKLAGVQQLPVVSSTGAAFPKASIRVGGGGGSNIEVALMLDVTGSMCADGQGPCTTSPKLDGLKSAANKLIDTVVSTASTSYTSKVALVPFSTRVRVGPDGGGGARMQALTNLPATWSGYYNMCIDSTGGGASETSGNWTCNQYQVQSVSGWKIMPCVTDRYYDSGNYLDVSEDAPGSARWLNGHGGDRMLFGWDSSDIAATSERGLTSADPAKHWNYEPNGECSDVSAANEIMPLSSDKSALMARVNGLEAYGATAGALGTSFAWYMLSPQWGSVWGGSSAPAPYSDLTTLQANGAPKLRKVAVLVSDGVYNTWRGWKEQDQQQVSTYAKQICANMKAQGIEIYTVGIALNELTPSESAIAYDTLRSCGDDVKHFYDTLTIPQMEQAFQDIALQLSALHLSR